MKRFTFRLISLGLLVTFCVALLTFSVYADDASSLLFIVTSTSNASSANPAESTFGATFTSPVSPVTVISSGAHNRINKFNIRTDSITSTRIFIRLDFTLVCIKSPYQNNPATIDDLFPISISGYNQYHAVSISSSNSNYNVRCYQYMLGEYIGDLGNLLMSGISENVIYRGNKTLSFLIEITTPFANQTNGLTLTLDSPITLYHTLNRNDTLHLICTHAETYLDYSDVLFSYLVDIRNDLNQAEFNSAGIWQLLVNHEGDIDNLEKLTDILSMLTSMRSDLMAVRQSLLQLFTSNSPVPQFNWTYLDISQDQNGNYVFTEQHTNWYMAVLKSIQNITFDLDRSLKYQNQIDEAAQNSQDDALESALSAVSDANSIGNITGFTSIFNLAPNNPEQVVSQGGSGFLFWFTQQNYDDLQQNEISSNRGISDGWVMPYDDKVAKMISDLEGGDSADESD